jgi:predicted type IV restriction endonuclease
VPVEVRVARRNRSNLFRLKESFEDFLRFLGFLPKLLQTPTRRLNYGSKKEGISMALDKKLTATLKKYAQVFKEARERDANESDTVMYLTKFFEEVLEYDSLKGEISKELAVKDRFCDIALKIDREVELLVEAKAAGLKVLSAKHIEQAENYASRSGLSWVLLTSGYHWQLYHVSFAENEGIKSDLAFDVEFSETNLESFWSMVSLLSKKSIEDELLEDFWGQKKALKPSVLVKVLFSSEVLTALRRELNRQADARLEMEDVFESVKAVVTKESLMDAGEIALSKKKRKKRRPKAVATAPVENIVVDPDKDQLTTLPVTDEIKKTA